MKLKITTKIEDGVIVPFPVFRERLEKLAKKHTVFDVTIKPYCRTRSLEQNKYYWGVIVMILGNELGYCKDMMHEALTRKFLSHEEKGLTFVKSTSELSTKEMNDYIEQIKQWAIDFCGIVLPEPDEVET